MGDVALLKINPIPDSLQGAEKKGEDEGGGKATSLTKRNSKKTTQITSVPEYSHKYHQQPFVAEKRSNMGEIMVENDEQADLDNDQVQTWKGRPSWS